MLKKTIYIYTFLILLIITGCAKRGSITGGSKDTIAPYIIGSSPNNMVTNFKGKEIHIDFNEYIKIKDINKQLIISPPLKYNPDITPQGSASKFINIKIKDTLEDNTTYSFNFGQSITDNNEGNPYSQFRFVFSTGDYIDSLHVGGSIKDAYSLKTDNFVTVMLYEANETFNDSTIYKQKPRYVTNTLDSLITYSLQNLKAGQYHVFALKDASNNYKFDPKSDKIAFRKGTITVPSDSVYPLTLFKQKPDYKPLKPTLATSNRLYLGYEGGDARNIKATVKNGLGTEVLRTMVTKVADKDSLQIWLPRDIKADSLQVQVTHRDSIKDFTVKIKELKAADSLSIEAVQKGGLHFRERFTLRATTPLVAIDSTKIRLINKDSIAVPYTLTYRALEQEVVLDFKKDEAQRYQFLMLPGAFTDFYDKQSDTLQYKLSTRNYTDYGNMTISLVGAKRFPIIVELTDEKDKVYESAYTEGETQIVFEALEPRKYFVRVIYDDNKNREWDTGDYMKKVQPEEVKYLPREDNPNAPKEINLRANWEDAEIFPLGG
jgi:uncharacterized protein (DUF2141 family)